MQRNDRFTILSEGQKNGVSATCRQYGISRTLYYRWLKRYSALGMDGLDDVDKTFIPSNKTPPDVEAVILDLIKTYPHYGPKPLHYLLHEMGHPISESAVYNVMKRHNLTRRDSRLRYLRQRTAPTPHAMPDLTKARSGECWLAWITCYGTFEGLGTLYEYTILDVVSRIACSRLYDDIDVRHMEDLLTAVALPIAHALDLEAKHLILFNDGPWGKRPSSKHLQPLQDVISEYGFDIQLQVMDPTDESGVPLTLRSQYTTDCMASLMPLIHGGTSMAALKRHLQQYLRDYNISNPLSIQGTQQTPVQYHSQATQSPTALPVWAYIDRPY